MCIRDRPYLKKARDWNNVRALTLIDQRWQSGTLPAPHAAIAREVERTLEATRTSDKLA